MCQKNPPFICFMYDIYSRLYDSAWKNGLGLAHTSQQIPVWMASQPALPTNQISSNHRCYCTAYIPGNQCGWKICQIKEGKLSSSALVSLPTSKGQKAKSLCAIICRKNSKISQHGTSKNKNNEKGKKVILLQWPTSQTTWEKKIREMTTATQLQEQDSWL